MFKKFFNIDKKVFLLVGIFLVISIVFGVVFSIYNNKNSKKYVISFNTVGGSYVETQIVSSGNKVKKPIDPTKDGYIFYEWTYNDKKYDFSTVVTNDLTLVAKWLDKDEKYYTVVFNTDGGNEIDKQLLKENELVKKPDNPVRDGYVFIRWLLNNDEYNFDNVVNEDLTLVAEWEKLEEKEQNNISNNNSGNSNTNNNTNNKPQIENSENEVETNNQQNNGPILSSDVKDIHLKVGDKKDITITYTQYGNISRKISNSNIVSTSWGKWNGNLIKLTVTGKEPGETDIVIDNTYNDEKITIKIYVDGPWKDVNVSLPKTIGCNGETKNRMEITKYNFASYSSNYYKMYITMKLVQFNKPSRTNWGSTVYFYDNNDNVIDDGYIYASDLYLNGEYQDDMLIPINTAKIVFIENPDNSIPVETTDPKKWTYNDAVNLNNYMKKASEASVQASDSANKAFDDPLGTKFYLTSSLNYMEVVLSYLTSAKKLAESKANLSTTDGSSLLQEINEAIYTCEKYKDLTIDENDLSTSQMEIQGLAVDIGISLLSPHKLSVDLLGEFVQ